MLLLYSICAFLIGFILGAYLVHRTIGKMIGMIALAIWAEVNDED